MINSSGWKPIEYNVLIKQVETKETTTGGVFIPQHTQDREEFAETVGTIVDTSPMAFDFPDWPDDVAKPSIGDRVIFEKHAGRFVDGTDGEKYRLIKDKEVMAVAQ